MNYIRVETMNTHTEETLGGYICAAHSILSVKLGVPPTTSDEELARIINESDDPEVQDVFFDDYGIKRYFAAGNIYSG